MNIRSVNRRELLGTAALGAASLAIAPSFFATRAKAASLSGCNVNHVQLSNNLATLLNDPSVAESEKNFARKTCSCIQCGVGIAASHIAV